MLGSEEDWERVAEFVDCTLHIKKVDLNAQSVTRVIRGLQKSGTQREQRLVVDLDVGNMREVWT